MTDVLLHETHHAVAAAIGAHALGLTPAQYAEAEVFFEAKTTSGFFYAHLHNPHEQRSIQQLNDQLIQLCAFGPIARVGVKEATRLMRKGDTAALTEAGDLSDTDVEIAESWAGPPLAPARVVIGTALLEAHKGRELFRNFAHKLRGAVLVCAQNAQPLYLGDVVPWAVSNEFHDRAKDYLAQQLKPKFYNPRTKANSARALVTELENRLA
ncbi:hypothetical protein [Ruegeria lacuscaerulensis]|uniref:hypothetical protein n=1 Tax=Ruegeria lacuscaerulensis TaxID=55218 RepID=UPI00148150F8|nr:hypothetical protein [Ruegeria lacuscaerulensis]